MQSLPEQKPFRQQKELITNDLVRIYRQCLGFTELGRQAKVDSTIENEYKF